MRKSLNDKAILSGKRHMCGICGIYNKDGYKTDKVDLLRMNATLNHRGPDDEGYYIDEGIALGHRRLSIIDLNTGHQPIFNENNTISVVFNGEIYNFLELKTELEAAGHQFKTKTDTEVIIHGYEQWSFDCVKRFRGMFAFALWDKQRKTLFLGRDRLGIKPLYYADSSDHLAFASEIKALIEDRSVEKQIDIEALSDYLSLGYIPAPKTIFQSIKKLPAACILIRTSQGVSIKQYWRLDFEPDDCQITESEHCEHIIELLDESVKMRLISDVPLGAFLSGGIDSSLVVAIMAGLMTDPVITNSIGFNVQKFNELEYAKETASLFSTDHHEYTVTPDAVDVVNRLSWFFDEPFADSSSIPTYYVSQMAKRKVTVALSGDGGDENFAGYRRYYYDRLENRIRSIFFDRFREKIIGPLARRYPKADRLPQFLRAKTLLTNITYDPVMGYFNSMSHFLTDMKKEIMSSDLNHKLNLYDTVEVFRDHYNRCASEDPLTRIQYIDFNTYLVDDILTKVDRASMANSLEVRVPILDHKFVEYAASIPSNLKLKGQVSKYIFKKAASQKLPTTVINRKKMGFSIPLGKWLKKELRPLVQETILGKQFNERGYFSNHCVRRLWDEHVQGMRDHTQPLWILLSFELWARRFL